MPIIVHNRAGGIGVGSIIGVAGSTVSVGVGAGGGGGGGSDIVVKTETSLQRLTALLPLYACTFQ